MHTQWLTSESFIKIRLVVSGNILLTDQHTHMQSEARHHSMCLPFSSGGEAPDYIWIFNECCKWMGHNDGTAVGGTAAAVKAHLLRIQPIWSLEAGKKKNTTYLSTRAASVCTWKRRRIRRSETALIPPRWEWILKTMSDLFSAWCLPAHALNYASPPPQKKKKRKKGAEQKN